MFLATCFLSQDVINIYSWLDQNLHYLTVQQMTLSFFFTALFAVSTSTT